MLFRRAALALAALHLSCTGISAPAHSEPAPTSSLPAPSAKNESPALVLWAWERPEDLRFLNNVDVGVAFLAKTLTLAGEEVQVRPRMVPLRLPQGLNPIAVVRLEANDAIPPSLSRRQLEAAAKEVITLGSLKNVSGVQIDFDATVSQRPFYRELLLRVRGQLPLHLPLSITALTSWCLDDRWMTGLPISEAVPMLFRMGHDSEAIRDRLARGGSFPEGLCQNSVGLSTDERLLRFPKGQRTFLFHPRAWTGHDLEEALEWVLQGQER